MSTPRTTTARSTERTPMTERLPPVRARRKTVALFRALAHEGRLTVLLALRRRGEASVRELERVTRMEQSALSHQLRALREARLVRAERRGRQVFYALHDEHVAHIVGDAVRHVQEAP